MNQTHFQGNDVSSVHPTHPIPCLFIPENTNFPVVDAILTYPNGGATECILFQVTVKANDSPEKHAVQALLDGLGKNSIKATKLVWVVDRGSSLRTWQPLKDGASWDTYNNLEQYICVWDVDMLWFQDRKTRKKVAISCPPEWLNADVLKAIQDQIDKKATTVDEVESGQRGSFRAPVLYDCKKGTKST